MEIAPRQEPDARIQRKTFFVTVGRHFPRKLSLTNTLRPQSPDMQTPNLLAPPRMLGKRKTFESPSIGGVAKARRLTTRGRQGTSITTVRTKGVAWGKLYLSSHWSPPTDTPRLTKIMKSNPPTLAFEA